MLIEINKNIFGWEIGHVLSVKKLRKKRLGGREGKKGNGTGRKVEGEGLHWEQGLLTTQKSKLWRNKKNDQLLRTIMIDMDSMCEETLDVGCRLCKDYTMSSAQ